MIDVINCNHLAFLKIVCLDDAVTSNNNAGLLQFKQLQYI